MVLFVKNMVCNRCIMAVRNTMDSIGLKYLNVNLGEIEIDESSVTENKLAVLQTKLNEIGFEIIDDKKARIIEQIKKIIIQEIHHSNNIELKLNWSVFLSDKLNYEYNYLSSLFSSVEGITIEHYIIKQKVEKVKELIVYDELNISEIAYKLAYSSVAHLSSQFKKITGLSPSEFKKSHIKTRNTIDKL